MTKILVWKDLADSFSKEPARKWLKAFYQKFASHQLLHMVWVKKLRWKLLTLVVSPKKSLGIFLKATVEKQSLFVQFTIFCTVYLKKALAFILSFSFKRFAAMTRHVAAILLCPPNAIKKRCSEIDYLFWPYREEIGYKISVYDLLQNIESQEVLFLKNKPQRART